MKLLRRYLPQLARHELAVYLALASCDQQRLAVTEIADASGCSPSLTIDALYSLVRRHLLAVRCAVGNVYEFRLLPNGYTEEERGTPLAHNDATATHYTIH